MLSLITSSSPKSGKLALASLLLFSASTLTLVYAADDSTIYDYDVGSYLPSTCSNDNKATDDVQQMYAKCECLDGSDDCNKKAPSLTKFHDFCAPCTTETHTDDNGWTTVTSSAYWHCGSGGYVGFRPCNNCKDNGDNTVSCDA